MSSSTSSCMTIRDLGYSPGRLPTGPKNSILDIPGLQVGQATIAERDGDVVKGVTIILPRAPSEIDVPCYAGMHTLNGNGEVTGSFQIKDWGYTNTPLALTNSLSLGTVYQGLWNWKLQNQKARGLSPYLMSRNYGTPVVGETSDWGLNDIFHSALEAEHVEQAFANALTQTEVQEGQHGGGAGMTCHQFAGGTGTSSRVVKGEGREYTVGVICQCNYGHTEALSIGGVPIGKLLLHEKELRERRAAAEEHDSMKGLDGGSIVIYIFTDAPMLPHQLTRLAQRASVGLSQVGGHGVGRNHSGDIFVAVSTANVQADELLAGEKPNHRQPVVELNRLEAMKNESVDAVFRAGSEATEEAILNAMVGAREGRKGFGGFEAEGLPVERVRELLKKYLVVAPEAGAEKGLVEFGNSRQGEE